MAFIFLIQPIFRFKFLCWCFGKIKTPKSHSEIIWPLKWSLPEEDTEGCVEDQDSGKVLTILDDKIVLEDKDEPLSDRQKWFRGVKDGDGWFSLKKPLTYTIPDEDTNNLTEVVST